MKCYRDGGCGVYEMYSCSECPHSKPPKVKAIPLAHIARQLLDKLTDDDLEEPYKELQEEVRNED